MKTFCLCISVTLAVTILSKCTSAKLATKLPLKQKFEMDSGTEDSAPFTKTALARLDSGALGNPRATRSSDVTISNFSTKNFQLTGKSCVYGKFASGLTPEHKQLAKTSTLFRIKTKGKWIRVYCRLTYSAPQGPWFAIGVNNPLTGNAVLEESHSKDLSVSYSVTQSHNNQVKIMIYDA